MSIFRQRGRKRTRSGLSADPWRSQPGMKTMKACAAAAFAASILAASSAPCAEDDRNAFQSAGLVNELAASFAVAEARIEQLETDMCAIAVLVREKHTNLAASQNQIERLRASLNAAVARVIVLEAGNREWLEEAEARTRWSFERRGTGSRTRLRGRRLTSFSGSARAVLRGQRLDTTRCLFLIRTKRQPGTRS